ncbi:Secreted protein containing DUF1501 [Planctomycetales bacterium 10988]|nr:Secreted protein containing DUF1501 [Planctomycetales bacterium 10988]
MSRQSASFLSPQSDPLRHATEHLRFHRRRFIAGAGAAGLAWMNPLAELLARDAEQKNSQSAQSLILIWLGGGASQLETFDPHPGAKIAYGSQAIKTSIPGIQLATGLEQLAGELHRTTLIRSIVSKEGDHERGTYALKTGYRPDPTAVHPSIGSILCHELPQEVTRLGLRTEIPRFVSIMPNQWPGRGGLLGAEYDAFKTYDPARGIPDVRARVPEDRYEQRMTGLNQIEQAFMQRRRRFVQETIHRETLQQAHTMMTSDQLRAFDVTEESQSLQDRYGDRPFGRGCLAARRLTEVGVRCVEVTLNGWDSHANNHNMQAEQKAALDPAITTLIQDLADRDALRRTVVVCLSEFGRTPKLNGLEGRDHWPHGFSALMVGGRFRQGYVHGATDPEGGKEVESPVHVGDLHASLLQAFDIDYTYENISRTQRPIALAEGTPITDLYQ